MFNMFLQKLYVNNHLSLRYNCPSDKISNSSWADMTIAYVLLYIYFYKRFK